MNIMIVKGLIILSQSLNNKITLMRQFFELDVIIIVVTKIYNFLHCCYSFERRKWLCFG